MATLNLKKIGSLVKVEYSGHSDFYLDRNTTVFKIEMPSDGASFIRVQVGSIEHRLQAITDLQVEGVAVTNQADFETKIATVFPNPGGSGSQTLQEVLSEGATLTENASIQVDPSKFFEIIHGDPNDGEGTQIYSEPGNRILIKYQVSPNNYVSAELTADNSININRVVAGVFQSLSFDIGGITLSENNQPFEATEDSHIATKKYVDDNAGGLGYLVYTPQITQTGTSAPVVSKLFQNTVPDVPSWSRNDVGQYAFQSTDFPSGDNNVYISGFTNFSTANMAIPIFDGAAVIGYYSMYYDGAGAVLLLTYDETFTPADLSSLIDTDKFNVPEVRVYP